MAHGDYTGQKKAVLAQRYAEEQALAAKSQTLVTQIVHEGQNDVVDLFCDKDYENLDRDAESGVVDGVQQVGVRDPQFQPVLFRASEDLDDVTVGQGREFSLQAGRTYKAPQWVAKHLDSQGLVYH